MDKYDFTNVKGVIHVGAHDGREYEEYQTTFFQDIPIHWFEPQKKFLQNLSVDLVINLTITFIIMV